MDIYNGRNEVVCKVDTERCSKRKTYSDCQIVIRRAHLNFSFSDTVEYIVGKLYMEPEQFDGTTYKVAFPYYEGAVMVCEFTGKNFDDEAYTHLICAVAETLHTIIDEHLAKFKYGKVKERNILTQWKNRVVERYGIRKVCMVREDMPGYVAMKGREIKVDVK